MKKTKIFVLLTLSLILIGSMCTFAYTKDASGKWRGKLYNVEMKGNRGTMNAVGTVSNGKNVAYTAMRNDTTTTQYIMSEVNYYKHGGAGFGSAEYTRGYVDAGRQSCTNYINRNKTNDIIDYYHYGKVYVSLGSGVYYDEIRYIAKQYYE